MKPKLLVLTTTFPRWKNDSDPPFVYELSKRLTSSFEVTIHAPHYSKAKVRDVMDEMQIVRFRYFFEPFEKLAGKTGIIPTIRQNKFYLLILPFFLLAQLFSFFLLVLRLKPHVIHAHWVLPQGILATIAQLVFKIPFMVTAHGTDIFSLQGKLFSWLKCCVIMRATLLTAVSRALARKIQNLCGLPLDRIHILPMGVSSKVFNPDARDPEILQRFNGEGPFLLFVGRLSKVKGVTYLIDAMPKVLSVIPSASLLIIGQGELAQELDDQVKRLGLKNRIFFNGPLTNKDLPAYYATADIFIGASIHTEKEGVEGFGLTFVEAAMSGCLLIGTAVGGITDIITDNETGLMVREKNSDELADKIIYALQNEEQVSIIRKKGREKCMKLFEWQMVADKYADLLLAAAQKK
ncbi:MAG: glycosyltransferase [Desulfobulbaceae bacterium]|nr:glycosyltransferase [Desulfobulbaceae bacterium]